MEPTFGLCCEWKEDSFVSTVSVAYLQVHHTGAGYNDWNDVRIVMTW